MSGHAATPTAVKSTGTKANCTKASSKSVFPVRSSSSATVPLATERVLIDRPAGAYTVTVSSGSQGADMLRSEENLTIAGGSLSLANTGTTNGTLTVSGGTLTVNNLGGSYVAGDSFKLFNSQSYQGTFAATNLPSIAPLVWNWIPTNGTLAVMSTMAANPTNITATVSGNVLTLSWPADHTGWNLLVQTNNLVTGISSNTNDWTVVPGSAAINTTNITMDATKPTEFYRLAHP